MSIAIGSVIGWSELLLCTALWSAVSAQIDTGEDDDPTGDDSAGLGDPSGDDSEAGDPTGEDGPGTLVPPPQEQPPPPAAQPPASSPSAAPEPVSSAAQAPTPTPNAATATTSISASTPPTVTPAADTGEISGSQSNGGAVAGGVIGALIGVGILGAIAFFVMRKKKQQQTSRPARTSGDDLEEFRPQNEEMVGYHAWNAVSSSDMLASSAAYNTPAPPAPPHQYLPNQPTNNRW
ncbi:hypothetical protein BJV82DRAFT_179996 [Fennellomyces sp. T-0311]|nr:hypothetical protein BJV82DRAFT_179996 [Fennellomyces sp. T-0311]